MARLDRAEIIRKIIHLASSSIALLYWFAYSRDTILKAVLIVALFFLCAEYARLHFPGIRRLFLAVFGPALRQHEFAELTGATFVFASAVLTIFLFPRDLAVPAMLILSIADSLAALVGIPFGRHPFLGKSLEGSVTFFVASLVILFIFRPLTPVLLVLVALTVTVLEAVQKPFDDNILISLSAAALLYGFSFLPV